MFVVAILFSHMVTITDIIYLYSIFIHIIHILLFDCYFTVFIRQRKLESLLGNVYNRALCFILYKILCKNSFGINSITCLYKKVHYTVRNRGDLDSFIKTKTSILAISITFILDGMVTSLIPLTILRVYQF